jgi:hypothetical protein
MAREYIQKAGGVLIPVGDTQGLLVPQGADGFSFVPQAQASAAAGGSIVFKPETVTFARGMTIGSDGFFPVKAGDNILVKFPMMGFAGDNDLFNAIVSQYAADKTTIIGEAQVMAVTNNNYAWLPCVSYAAVQDGFCRLLLWNHKAVTNIVFTRGQRGNECVVTKISQQSPYIVANKGALVSGGAFQFDADGNGYTKNYFDAETVVGRWRDGRPVYARTFQKTFPTAGRVSEVLEDSGGNIDLIVNQDITYKHPNSWSTTGQIYYGGADPDGLDYILQITSNTNNLYIHRNLVDSAYTQGVFYITAYYVKIAD